MQIKINFDKAKAITETGEAVEHVIFDNGQYVPAVTLTLKDCIATFEEVIEKLTKSKITSIEILSDNEIITQLTQYGKIDMLRVAKSYSQDGARITFPIYAEA